MQGTDHVLAAVLLGNDKGITVPRKDHRDLDDAVQNNGRHRLDDRPVLPLLDVYHHWRWSFLLTPASSATKSNGTGEGMFLRIVRPGSLRMPVYASANRLSCVIGVPITPEANLPRTSSPGASIMIVASVAVVPMP